MQKVNFFSDTHSTFTRTCVVNIREKKITTVQTLTVFFKAYSSQLVV